MSPDVVSIQEQIDNAVLRPLGIYAATITLEPREYLFDAPVRVNKPVRIIGNNTLIRLTGPNITAFDVTERGCRFEQLSICGWPEGVLINEEGGIGFDIKASRVIIDDCKIEHCRIGVWLHSTSEDGQVSIPGANANMSTVRDSQFIWCISGLWTRGGDANAGIITNCLFVDCRRGITEQSFLGNHYVSNLVEACPFPGDPMAAQGYGILVPEDQPANYSTFTANFIENDSKAEVNINCLVVGGNLAARVKRGEVVGYSHSRLVFRGDNEDDLFTLGRPGVDGLGVFQRGGDSSTYASLGFKVQGGWAIRPLFPTLSTPVTSVIAPSLDLGPADSLPSV
jgi:hypothetical protein